MNGEIGRGETLLSKPKNKGPWVIFVVFDVILIGLILFYYFLSFSPIKGVSMMNTLQDGQCVILQRNMFSIERGDIVTLDTSKTDEEHVLIKRVIALSGDKLLFVKSENNTFIDMYLCVCGENTFKKMNEEYIPERMSWDGNPDSGLYEKVTVTKHIEQNTVTTIKLDEIYTDEQTELTKKLMLASCLTVPDGEIFFLGDNRNHSNDSRHYGTVSTDRVLGKVIKVLEKGGAAEKILRFFFNTYN